jgi:hypothetical protein
MNTPRIESQRTSTSVRSRDYKSAALTVVRTSLPLRSSTTPVLPMPIPAHPSSARALPGMAPQTHVPALIPRTVAMLDHGDFDGVFINVESGVDVAQGFGRYFVGQFGKSAAARRLISGRDLTTNMDCAGYADEPCFSFTSRSGSVDHAPENSRARSATAGSGS